MTSWTSAGSSGGNCRFPIGVVLDFWWVESIANQQLNLGCIGALRNRSPDTGPIFHHRVDKAFSGVGMALSARLQHVAEQEQAGEPETVLQVLIGKAVSTASVLAQKGRQPQQPVAPGLAGAA